MRLLKLIHGSWNMSLASVTVRDDPSSLRYVPGWFVAREWVCMWYDDSDYYADEDNFFKWYDGYKKRKAQKASIKEELLQNKWSLWSGLHPVHKIFKKFLKSVLLNDEHIFEKYNFKIIQHCVSTCGSNTRCACGKAAGCTWNCFFIV